MKQNYLLILTFLLLSLLSCKDDSIEADWFVKRVQPYWFGVLQPNAYTGGTSETIMGIKEGRWIENRIAVGSPEDRWSVVNIYNISGSLDWVVETSFDNNPPFFTVFRLINNEPHITLRNASLREFDDNMFSPIRIIDKIE